MRNWERYVAGLMALLRVNPWFRLFSRAALC